MSKIPGRLITYCTNIHPGESWAEVFSALQRHVPLVKSAVSPSSTFPIGLRLSRRAATELDARQLARFTAWLKEEDCFVPTINGFPYGDFHGARIKEEVYLPDWRSDSRAAYTIRLADLLANWLPDGVAGSISTVPVGFKGVIGRDDLPVVMKQITKVLVHLKSIYETSGKKLILALEPEPGCMLETTDEVCAFFADLTLPSTLSEHIGVCFDCCHQAVEFEVPGDAFARLAAAGVTIAKVQVSSALKFVAPDNTVLQDFAEPRYLHQVSVRGVDGSMRRYRDLPDALAEYDAIADGEWRCHFHVPIFSAGTERFGTTRFFLEEGLHHLPTDVLLEVETYTFDILPPELRRQSVTDSIIREIQWLEAQLDAAHGRS
jgi:hypothetical protein